MRHEQQKFKYKKDNMQKLKYTNREIARRVTHATSMCANTCVVRILFKPYITLETLRNDEQYLLLCVILLHPNPRFPFSILAGIT